MASNRLLIASRFRRKQRSHQDLLRAFNDPVWLLALSVIVYVSSPTSPGVLLT